MARVVTLPLAARGIGAGVALGFARALGDFGATVMVAGNIPGQTQTLPVAVYDAVRRVTMQLRARARSSSERSPSLYSSLSLKSLRDVDERAQG